MNVNSGNNDDKGFLLQLRVRAQEKSKEYSELLHERQRLEMRIERAKEYVEQLNNFLRAEGQQPILIKAMPSVSSTVGKPGNRAKDMPVRKLQWEGLSMNNIVKQILDSVPNKSFHHTEIAPEIYEINSDLDLRKVMKNLRSTLQKGARDGLWNKAGRARFQSKSTVVQERQPLVSSPR